MLATNRLRRAGFAVAVLLAVLVGLGTLGAGRVYAQETGASASKQCLPTSASLGDTINCTFVFGNIGDTDATVVAMTEQFPWPGGATTDIACTTPIAVGVGDTLPAQTACGGTFSFQIPDDPQLCGTVVSDRVEIALQYPQAGNLVAGAFATAQTQVVCANIEITPPTDTNAVGTNHELTLTVNAMGGTLSSGTATASIVSGPGTFVGGVDSCNYTGGAATASCTVQITSTMTGTTVVSATSDIPVNGMTLTRTTNTAVNTAQGGSLNAEKVWVDAHIGIAPLVDTNPVNTDHTFTITVTALNGTLESGTATAAIVSGPGSFVGGANTCNYTGGAATATCTVTITSATPGTTVVSATSDIGVNGQTITRITGDAGNIALGGSDNAQKVWEATTVEVIKQCPDASAAGLVTLVAGTFTTAANCPAGGTTGVQTVTGGQQITVGEQAVPGGFTATIACTGGVTVAQQATTTGNILITPPSGTNTVCTVINTVIPPTTVEVIKQCADATAVASVTLQVGAFTTSANCPAGGTTGVRTVEAGVGVVVGETAVPAGFTATIQCTGGVVVPQTATTTGNVLITPPLSTNTVCTVINTPLPAGEGCTPGYWRQPQHFGSWTGVSPQDTFASVFGRTITVRQGGRNTVENPTLLQAVTATGGDINALARHAVAAYLNAASSGVNSPYTTAQVVAMVQAAIDDGSPTAINDAKNLLAAANELGCPLGRDPGDN